MLLAGHLINQLPVPGVPDLDSMKKALTQEAVIKSPTTSQPSTEEIKGQSGNHGESDIRRAEWFPVLRIRFSNAKTAMNPTAFRDQSVEIQTFSADFGKKDGSPFGGA